KIFQEIANTRNETDWASSYESFGQLSAIFMDRQQYPRAVTYLQECIERFPSHSENRKSQLDQIIGNWGQFEPVMSTAAGQGATVDFRFRNAKSVTFEAHAIKVPE